LNRKPKILYLIDTLETGGAEKSLVELATHNKDIEPVFVHIYKGAGLKPVLQAHHIPVYSLDITDTYGFKKVRRQLKTLIQELKPDVIHATLLRSELIIRGLKDDLKIPLVGSIVSNSYAPSRYQNLSLQRRIKLKFFQYYNRFTAGKVDRFIANSENVRQAAIKQLHLKPEKVQVIYRGRQAENFKPIPDEKLQALKQELHIDRKIVFLTVGRLIQTKGHTEIIKAFAGLLKTHPDSILLIAGDGPEKHNLNRLITESKLEKSVKLLGNRSDVPALLQLADIFVFASRLEGLPGALIEAMFAGKRIISSDIPENLECVSPQDALIFKTGDTQTLQNLMQQAIENFDDLKILGENARKTALQKFELSEIIKQYNALYHDVIKNRMQ